ncbi:lipoprotein [Oleiphilus messinensis]|uniref:Lipoprotein n=1 Tax=Oleiphilus messinensis TaxID=141451 RepID=A0A1Y0IEF8_9GAMM|nr:hypothetical protein [Oleiphilus messinensis]ARU58918.1 lipoprotein [Oleiphilus messinensis]
MEKSTPNPINVELFWRLKKRIEELHIENIKLVQFKMLLDNTEYREHVIEQAKLSTDPELLEIIREIEKNDGKVGRARTTSAASGPQPIPQSRIYKQLFYGLASIFLVVLGTTGFINLFEHRPVHISQDISSDQTWTRGEVYILDKLIYVRDGAKLTIEPGVTIQGKNGSALIVTQHSSLHAKGTAEAPIVFTSAQALGKRQPGDWGGLVLLGQAPVNSGKPTIEGVAENDQSGLFGGDNPDHSCGVMEYVRIEFAGYEVYANNELNGLTLGGCGANTIIRNVQVHRALDDGIEVFGGTVDLKNIVITGAGDDGLDWDMGWQGRVQFLVVQQYADTGDNAFEGDNNKKEHNAQPRSNPTFYNVTLASSGTSGKAHRGILVRHGSGGYFHNMLISGFSKEAVDFRDEIDAVLGENALDFSHNIVSQSGPSGLAFPESEAKDNDYGFDEKAYVKLPEKLNTITLQGFLTLAAKDQFEPRFAPPLSHDSFKQVKPIPQGDFWDESAQYPGALPSGSGKTWLDGWTAYPEK